MPDMNMQTYEEVHRHQLVTEFDIQSQSELEDYQVQLENVDNPTQAQDNLVISVNGESLSHWNESLDFDTWIKVKIGISGKRGLLIHGNEELANKSSITDTMMFGDDFLEDLSKWSGDVANYGIVNNKLPMADTTAKIIYASIGGLSNTIIESKISTTSNGDTNDYAYGIAYRIDAANRCLFLRRSAGETYARRWGDQAVYYSTVPPQWTDNVYGIDKVIVGSTVANSIHSFNGTTITGVANYNSDINADISIYSYATLDSDNVIDWVFVRKYAAIEPIVHIGTPKNISTALKSFGRAG